MSATAKTLNRYPPKGSMEIRPKDDLDAVVYVTINEKGRPTALAYSGKRSKSDFHYIFLSVAKCEEYVTAYFDGLRRQKTEQAEKQTQRKTWEHGLQVGDLLYGSWGYDQTNPEFFRVMEVKGKSVLIQEVAQKTIPGSEGFMSDRRRPAPDETFGPVLRRIPQMGYDGKPRIKLHESCSLHPWERGEGDVYCSWYA